jgi:uncharacterized membrane protein YkvA (DUF1232 family)
MLLRVVLTIVGGLLVAWVALVAALLVAARRRGDRTALRDIVRLVPDVVRLFRRLAGDQALPRGVRVRMALLTAYLVMPFDLVPDFIPVVGWADDALVVVWGLRSITRAAGVEAVDRHWPGTTDGLLALKRLAGLPTA